VSNLSFGSGAQVRFASPTHLSTSAPLSRPGHRARYPASYPATTAWRSHPRLCWFPVGFRLPAFASWTSCSRQRIPLSSRSAYRPAARAAGLCRGSHVPHAWDATGLGASFTPGRRCPPDQRSLSDRRLPLPNGQPYTPLKPPTGGAADNGAYEDSLAFTRPVFPSPVAPGWNGSASAVTLGFAPRSHPRRTPGRGRSHGHWTGSHPRLPTSNRR